MPHIPAVLIANPVAGSGRRGRRLTALLERLRDAGWAAELRTTRAAGDATRLAREASEEGRKVVFVHGGDGTVRETARGLMGTGTALGILPGGTTNVLARALGLPPVADRVPAVLARGSTAAIDVGLAGGEPFLMMVSGGLDGAVMARQSPRGKRLFGRAAFALPGLAAWWRYAYPVAEARFDETTIPGTLIAVCNIPLYGGAFRLAPDAVVHDRRLDLVVQHGRRWASLAFAADLWLGARHLRRPDVVHQRVRRVEIDAPAGFRFQVDGDALEVEGPLVVQVAEERLRVLLPPGPHGS